MRFTECVSSFGWGLSTYSACEAGARPPSHTRELRGDAYPASCCGGLACGAALPIPIDLRHSHCQPSCADPCDVAAGQENMQSSSSSHVAAQRRVIWGLKPPLEQECDRCLLKCDEAAVDAMLHIVGNSGCVAGKGWAVGEGDAQKIVVSYSVCCSHVTLWRNVPLGVRYTAQGVAMCLGAPVGAPVGRPERCSAPRPR